VYQSKTIGGNGTSKELHQDFHLQETKGFKSKVLYPSMKMDGEKKTMKLHQDLNLQQYTSESSPRHFFQV